MQIGRLSVCDSCYYAYDEEYLFIHKENSYILCRKCYQKRKDTFGTSYIEEFKNLKDFRDPEPLEDF